MIEKKGDIEKWQKIGDDWWGTSYKNIQYNRNVKNYKYYYVSDNLNSTASAPKSKEIEVEIPLPFKLGSTSGC